MPFSQKNPFNADANFTSIKFGVNKPVLEVELNEMQSILRNHSKDSIKELFGDGVVGKGQYTYTSNKFTLANEVAILDGEVIKVDSISINANNGDTIYLQSAIELKAYTDSIKKYGNSASATTVTNTIKDSRVNMETSRREQLVYNLATTVNGAKNNLKLGTIKNDTFVLDCPVLNQNIVNETVEGSYITVENTKYGAITDIEILGNTVQDSSNLADIKSVGITREEGNYEIELKSCGKNLFNLKNHPKLTEDGGVVTVTSTDKQTRVYKLKPNTSYTLSFNKYGSNSCWVAVDVNNTYVNNNNTNFKKTYVTGQDGLLSVSLSANSSGNIGSTICNIQLEEGTNVTTYEPHQETTSKIILPCQLEKVGTVSDRLFRREDGVWCIEKNIFTRLLDGSEGGWGKRNDGDGTTTMSFQSQFSNIRSRSWVISDKIPFDGESSTNGVEGVSIDITTFHVEIRRDRLPSADLSGFKSWLSQNNLTIKYQAETPEIIELPLDTQISLNSFFGTTNVFIESGEVDGTIKCTVPKSLGGSIKSLVSKADSIEERVEKIENLQKGNDMQVSINNKKYVVVEDTNDGYITDFKIEGETLVNLFDIKNNVYPTEPIRSDTQDKKGFVALGKDESSALSLVIEGNKIICGHTSSAYRGFGLLLQNLKPTTVYTIIMTKSGADLNMGATIKLVNGLNKFNVTTSTEGKWYGNAENIVAGTFTIEDVIVLEGDYTDKDLSYFEGLKSVGEHTEGIELISRNESTNQVDDTTILPISITKGYAGVSGFVKLNLTSNDFYFYLGSNIGEINTYTVAFRFKDAKGEDVGSYVTTSNRLSSNLVLGYANLQSKGVDYKLVDSFEIFWNNEAPTCVLNDLYIGSSPKFDFTYNIDKKKILYKNSEGEFVPIPALRGIKDNVRDTIELHSDGKYYYHKRCEEVVLNGSEGWYLQGDYSKYIEIINYTPTPKVDQKGVCDKLPTGNSIKGVSTSNPIEIGIYGNGQLRLKPYAKDNMTLTEGIEWLQQNPVTYVYALATEEVYECNYLDLNSYEGETLVQIESGVISPAKLSFKHSTHIGNIVTKMKEDVDKNTKFREEMTESVTYKKTFDTEYEVFEDTKEGSVEVKIEGNTLVNFAPKITQRYNDCDISSNKGFTVITSMQGFTGHLMLRATSLQGTAQYVTAHSGDGYKVQYYSPEQYKAITRVYFEPSDPGTYTNIKCIILEGDHTQNPPSYFEGLKSVGEYNESLHISSHNRGNLLKNHSNYTEGYYVSRSTGTLTANTSFNASDYIPIWGKTIRGIKCNLNVAFYDKNKEFLGKCDMQGDDNDFTAIVPDKAFYVRFSVAKDTINTSSATIGNEKALDTIFKGCNKQILYKNSSGVYEKPILRSTGSVSDSIEKHSDGKYYFHKRCEEIVFDGSSDEGWSVLSASLTNTKLFSYTLGNSKATVSDSVKPNILNDRFNINTPGDTWNLDNEGITLNRYSSIHICILNTKLSSQDATGFKTWLKSNPVTVVYQLATEEVYEVVNLDLDSYEGETSVFLPSTIPAKITASVGSNLIKTLQSMKDRINYLEDKVISMFKSVLSGDVQTLAYMLYPEDFKEEDQPTTLEEPLIVYEVVEGIMPLALEVEEEQPKKKTRTRKKTTKKSE